MTIEEKRGIYRQAEESGCSIRSIQSLNCVRCIKNVFFSLSNCIKMYLYSQHNRTRQNHIMKTHELLVNWNLQTIHKLRSEIDHNPIIKTDNVCHRITDIQINFPCPPLQVTILGGWDGISHSPPSSPSTSNPIPDLSPWMLQVQFFTILNPKDNPGQITFSPGVKWTGFKEFLAVF